MKMSKFAFFNVRVFFAVTIFTVAAAAGFTQVDRSELQDLPPVVFINYEGPHSRLDTWEEVRQLGVVLGVNISERERGLAPAIAGMSNEEKRAYSYRFDTGASNRYFVIHCVSGEEESKINADIFGLGVDTGVDHIRNLRLIIRGYLQSAYNYSSADAALLAEYITIYNAVYRGNWDYFTGRYKNQVIGNLTRERAGLSIRYDEWPGRTLILIPLGHGGLSSIDTSTISDRRVIEELRKEDDQGVPQRQEMVNLMEREAQQAERQARSERDNIRQEERQIAEERRQTQEERRQIDQQRQQATDDEKAQLDRREEVVQQKEDELAKREDNLQDRRGEADRLEQFAEQKTEEAQRQREEIAIDQQAAIAEDTGGIFGIAIDKPGLPMGYLVRFNPADGRELKRSPLNTTHVRTVAFVGGRIIAIAGENVGIGAVRLVEINQNNLEMAKQGNDDILPGSLLWVNGNDLYAITTDLNSGKNYLGFFDTNLSLKAKSAATVHPEASVTIQQGRLLTQREDGSVLILNPANLTEIR